MVLFWPVYIIDIKHYYAQHPHSIAHRCHFPDYRATSHAFWLSCLFSCCYAASFLVILFPLQSLVPQTDLAPPQPERCLVADLKCFNWGLDATSQRHAPLLCASSALVSPHFLSPPNFHCQGHNSGTAESVCSFVRLARQTGKHQPVTEGSHWCRNQLWWF